MSDSTPGTHGSLKILISFRNLNSVNLIGDKLIFLSHLCLTGIFFSGTNLVSVISLNLPRFNFSLNLTLRIALSGFLGVHKTIMESYPDNYLSFKNQSFRGTGLIGSLWSLKSH